MELDRVVDFDSGYQVYHFLDLGGNLGIWLITSCEYKGEIEDWIYRKPDLSKLIPRSDSRTTIDVLPREGHEGFEYERRNWLKEPDSAMPFENIKPDKLFWHAVKRVSKTIIREVLSS
jgi:hypothetical protein